MTPLTLAKPAPNETPEQALRRLERNPDYGRLILSDAGQALLAKAQKMADAARRQK